MTHRLKSQGSTEMTHTPWKKQTPKCNYCSKPAVEWFEMRGSIVKYGQRRSVKYIVASCDEHKNCVNFLSNKATRDRDQQRINSLKGAQR